VTLVAPGFEVVAAEFERVLGDGGAAFAAVVDGEPVVDLTSGLDEDALLLIFSGTKGLVAVCMLLLLERGGLELDAPVARYWPGFHPDVLVRHVVSHTSGVPALRRGIQQADLLDGRALAAEVAREPPFWPPGTRLAYHAFTYGVLCDELIRRVDGRSTGRFFAEEVAAPLALELWIGLPREQEHRVATLHPSRTFQPAYDGAEPDPLYAVLYGDVHTRFPWNDRPYHRAEIPAANAIGTARSIARLYGNLEQILAPETILLGRTELSRDCCAITRLPYAFGVGFELQTELLSLGPPNDAFGHTGSGGSSHGAWPSERGAFSFAMTDLRSADDDERAARVLTALHQALRERSSVDQKSSPVSM
jgi:CubicO group peptidase (beta-lactamase class C family)